MLRKAFWITLLLLCSGLSMSAQSAVPIISGGLQYLSTTTAGATVFQPLISPVVAIPIRDRWLIESRGTFDEVIFRENGTTGPYHALTFSSVDYLQLDYIASPHLTITVGQFLTPFNIYNERLGPVWIHNLADPPLIAGIGTRTSGSSDGAMLRGLLFAQKKWELNYTAAFSAQVNARQFGAGRTATGRLGLFLPASRFEVGVTYQRFLQQQHYNSTGFYLVWEPHRAPIELRAEYAHSLGGQGYWLEGAYRVSTRHWLSRLQPVARVEQFYVGTHTPLNTLPDVDTKRFEFGLNYYLPHYLRLNASYGRQFSSEGNVNIWNVQITHRFLFPLIPGGSK